MDTALSFLNIEGWKGVLVMIAIAAVVLYFLIDKRP